MSNLDERTRSRLIEAALQAQRNAYVPYSHYPVGAALLGEDGRIYTGCNIENASYSATICAERTAIVKAASEGARRFTAIAVTTANGVFPCGVCRQVLNEFGSDMLVIAADSDGQVIKQVSLGVLLPGSFGPDQLDEGQQKLEHGAD
jgi:cytidine deaminase